MTLQEIVDNIDNMTSDEERQEILTKVIDGFSFISKSEVTQFMNNWDRSRPFEEFVQEQNKLIKTCLQMELTELGKVVRETQKLPVWTPQTTLEELTPA
jgi:hypothetical protein